MNLQDTLARHYPTKPEGWRQGYKGWSPLRGECWKNPFAPGSEAHAHFEAGKRQAETDFDNSAKD